MQIASLDDARLAAYRNVRERNLRGDGLFLTEGALLAERLLNSRFEVESVFVTEENAERWAQILGDSNRPQTPLYFASASLMREIVGFDFHRGVLAVGKRTPFPNVTDLIANASAKSSGRAHFLACPATETSENLGLLLRCAAAFDVSGILLSSEGADPLSRRCLRQSMGSALTLPIAVTDNLINDLRTLRQSQNLPMIAAVAGENAVSLTDFTFPPRAVLIVGHEYQGLSESWLSVCDYHVTIPISPNCDSLNVAVATGIFLHHMRSS